MTDKKGQMMDPSAPEGEAKMYVNRPRNTYAMDTLIAEVTALFPYITYEVSHRNKRNVAFDVQFDLSGLGEDTADAALLLSLLEETRIEEVVIDAQEESVLVSFVNDPRIMDSRDPFDLADAWIVLSDDSSPS